MLGEKPDRFIVCFRMLITDEQRTDPSDGFSRNNLRP